MATCPRVAFFVATILLSSGCVSNTPNIPRIAISPGASERLARFGGGPPFEGKRPREGDGPPLETDVRGDEGADAEGAFVLLQSGTAGFRVRCGSVEPFDAALGGPGASGRLALGPAPVDRCRVLRARPAKTAEGSGFEAVFAANIADGGTATTTVRLLAGDRGVLVETIVDGGNGAAIIDTVPPMTGRTATIGRSPALRTCSTEARAAATYEGTFVVSAAKSGNEGAAWAITGADGVVELPCAPRSEAGTAVSTVGGARVVVVASYTDEAAAVVELERAAGHEVGTVRVLRSGASPGGDKHVATGKIDEEFQLFASDGTPFLTGRLHADRLGRPSAELPVGTFRFGRDAAHAKPLVVTAGGTTEIAGDW